MVLDPIFYAVIFPKSALLGLTSRKGQVCFVFVGATFKEPEFSFLTSPGWGLTPVMWLVGWLGGWVVGWVGGWVGGWLLVEHPRNLVNGDVHRLRLGGS